MIDFGDDALTAGRAHPMIDPTLRLEHLREAPPTTRTGVILLDVVLGHGAEPDPAAALAPAIATGPRTAGRRLACVGTDADPQGPTAAGRPRWPRPAPRCTCPTPRPPGARSSCSEAGR